MTEKMYYSSISENPMGTENFEFLEFASLTPTTQIEQFKNFGFKETAKHPEKAIWLFEQNGIRFILNAQPATAAYEFAKKHGPCVSAMGFKIKDASKALSHLEKIKEKIILSDTRTFDLPTLQGVGGSFIYLVDAHGQNQYEKFFDYTAKPKNPGNGLAYIDHVTHNLFRGNMDVLFDFYQRIFNFHQIRYFDITGKMTGLVSRALTSPCGNIRIPLNESSDDKSQIEEFLKLFKGEGIQHIALATKDIYNTVETLHHSNIEFLETPDVYFDMIEKRLPNHGEDLSRLRKNKILIDGTTEKEKKLLLQIFTQNMLGPVFFEIIQRKGDEGFGEGNFKALFEAIELDQIKRGVL